MKSDIQVQVCWPDLQQAKVDEPHSSHRVMVKFSHEALYAESDMGQLIIAAAVDGGWQGNPFNAYRRQPIAFFQGRPC